MTKSYLRSICAAALVAAVLGACNSSEAAILGEEGDPGQVDRVVEIDAMDTLRFEPDAIEVEAGETIEFRISNEGEADHEFVLGPPHEHHEGMEHMEPSTTGTIDGGDTASVVWAFPEAGAATFACYIDGHNEAGMTGTVTVTE